MHPQVTEYTNKVDTFMAKYPNVTFYDKFKEIETTTGYPAAWFFLAAFLLATGLLTVIGGAKLLVDLCGFVYPAYQSFKSMDSSTTSAKDETQWLTYWVVFSFLTIVESIFAFLTVLIPFYYWLKIAVLVWMWHPTTRGAQTIYEQLLRPTVVPYLEKMDGGKSE